MSFDMIEQLVKLRHRDLLAEAEHARRIHEVRRANRAARAPDPPALTHPSWWSALGRLRIRAPRRKVSSS